MKRFLLSAFFLLVNSNAFGGTHCNKFSAPLSGGFCITRSETSQNPDFVYHLHGAGHSENTWQDDYYYTGQIRKFWEQHKAAEPTVISLSFGPRWLLAPVNSSRLSGLFEAVTQQIIPQLEKSLGELHGRRILLGESMGGFNAVQLAFKTRLFSKAAILCSPMPFETSPFSTEAEIKAEIEKSAAYQYYHHDMTMILQKVESAAALSRTFFPTLDDWKAADPLELAQSVDPHDLPKLYVAVGLHDEYAAYEGNEKFVRRLQDKGVEVEWRPQWGGHCAIDIPSVANFLIQ